MNENADVAFIFGQRVRQLRLRRGLTQRQLASAVGVHESFVSTMERGIKAPGLEVIVGVARALDVRVGELFPDYEPYPKEIADFLIWLRENPDVSLRDVMRTLVGRD